MAAGEFDDILDAKAERTSGRVSAPVDADDEFDDVLNARAERQHRYISTLIEAAVKDNPGAAAERDRLSRSTGLPPDVVARNQQELKRKEMVRAIDLDLNRMMRDSPILYRHFADPSFASMAIDDVGPLTRLGRTILSVPADITAQGLGLPELALKTGGEFLDWGAGNQPHANPLRDAGEWLGTIRQGQQALAQEQRGDQSGAGFFEQGVLGGVSSFVQMLPGMLGTIATGNPAFALWAAGLQSGSTTAADAMDSGLPAWRSGLVGMTDGMIETITEMAPAFKFVESMKVGDSFARFFGKQLMTELPGELLATLGQEYNAWAAGLRGDADLGEWVRTLPEAQAQTVIATLTMVALTSGLGRGAVRLLQDRKAAEEAPQKAERLRELFELSSASALRQRAPETFAEFVDQAAADGQQTLYLDAEALAQSVRQMPPEELERALPGAAEQLARGERWVSVPLGAAMAGVPGTALEDLIVQHSKLDPEGLTLTEASAATEQADSLIATEIDRIQQEATDQAVVIEQIDRVRGVIEEQIVASGRHSPDVAAVQAEWLARAYTVLADAEGMTPDQLWAERPLIIRAQQGMAASNGVNAGDKLTQNTGPFGQVFTEYRGDAQGAIARLTQEQSGDATAALSHPEIGDIDLVWGKAGTNRHDGYGLAKLVRWHPEVLSDLQGLIGSMRVTQRSENRVHLESEDHEASVRLQWDGQSKHWLLTAYQKRGSDTGTRTDIAGADVADDSPPTASEAIVEQDMQQFYQANAQRGRRTYDNGIPQGLPAERTADSDALERIIDAEQRRAGLPEGFQAVAVRQDQLPDALRGALAGLERATGTRVVIFRALTPEIADFNGVTIRDGVLYVSETAQSPATSTAAHEWVHNLRKTNPDLYARLENEVRRQGDAYGFAAKYGYTMGQAHEELTAAAVGDALTDPKFLERLAEHDAGLFTKMARAFLKFLKGFADGWRNQGSDAFLQDVQAFHDVLEEVLHAYERAKPKERAQAGFVKSVFARFQRVWHGTPHRGIETTGFKLNKIGSGEGAQAYGWGMYFASQREVAQRYQPRNKRAEELMMAEYSKAERAGDYESLELWEAALTHKLSDDILSEEEFGHIPITKRDAVARKVREIGKKTSAGGSLYSANIPENDELLDWDKPLSEQPEKVRQALIRADVMDESVLGEYTGQQLYEGMVRDRTMFDGMSRSDSAKAASEHLQSLGIPGLRYLDGNSRGQGEGSHNYVIWDEALLTPENADIQALYQRGKVVRAAFNPSEFAITLGPDTNLTSLHHESAHAFLELLHYLAARDGASERSRGMMDAALKWMGIAGDTPEERLAAWGAMSLNEKRAGHEQFAEGYEAYLFEGKAPTPELQRLMGRFRAWMKQAYGSLKQFFAGKGWQLDPEIRAVYDRILATDAEIRSAEERAGLVPDDAATTAAIEKLTAQSLRDLRWAREARNKTLRALQREAASKRKAVREEVAAEVMASPLEQVRKILRTTKEEDVNTPALMDALGVSSPEELARVLTLAPSAAEMIEAGTDRRMLERYGELTDPEALAAAADAAVHNEARARALAAELRAQDEVMGERADTGRRNARGARITENVVLEAGKRFADSIVRSTPVGELKAKRQLYLAAERKAARAQRAATAAGKTADAIAAQKDQLLNHLVAKGLMDAVDEADAAREEFKEYVKAGMKAQVTKGRDPAIVSMLRVIMGQYGIIERQAEKARDYLQMVQAFDPITSQRLEAIIAQAEQNAKPYKALTVDELQALRDLLGSIWEIAKTSRMMEVDGKQMRREDAAKMLLARMEEKGIPKVIPGEYGAITPGEERVLGLKGAMAWLVRVEQWTQAMDGKWGGPFTRLIFQPIKEAADRYRADRVVYLKKYEALIKQIEPYLHADPIVAHELGGYTFSGHTALLHALLHTGNESNKRKLLLGRQWASLREDGTMDTSKWDAFLQRMHDSGVITKAHWDFVQGVWDLLEETKPLAQATHRRVFGRFFDEVAADPVTTPFGTYRGGYVPAQADARQTPDAAVRALVEDQNASMINAFPEPARGFTKGRVEYNAPLLLDLGALRQHIDKVLLFAHMEGPVTDVTKLLTDKEVSNALFRISPHAYDTILLPWLKTASRQTVETPIAGDRGVHRLVTWMRSRSGMALMFANVSNTLQQVTGFVTALNKVKASSLRRAAARYIAHPADMTEVIKAKSIFMRNRIESEVSAINASMEKILINAGVFARAEMWTQEHAYFMQSAVDNVMGPIVWSAAYDEASARGESEKDAIRWADSVIRTTQGSQLPEDVARFETGNPWARLFSQFAGYFGMLANTSASELVNIHEQGLGLVRGSGKALMIGLYGVALPIWIAEAIAIAMRGGPEDDDDDGYLDDWMAAVFGWGSIRGATAMIPYAGQAVLGIATRLNDNPVDDRLSLSPAISLIESTVGVPANVYRVIIGKGTWASAAKSAAGGATLLTGLPIYAVARPISYTLGMAEGRIEPQGPWDATRGLITGAPSPESKQRP